MKPLGAGWATISLAAALVLQLSGVPAAGQEAPRWVAQRFIGERAAVGLAWTAVPGAERYQVLRRAEGEAGQQQVGATAGLQYLDATVARGVRYRYAVRAVGPGGPGPLSIEAEVLALEPQLVPPPAPRWTDVAVAFQREAAAVQLLWAPVAGAVVYNVYRRTPSDPQGEFRLRAGVADCTFTDAEVGAGLYEYRLSVVNGALVEGALSEARAVKIEAARAGASQRTPGQTLRVRPGREALVLRGGEKLPIRAPVDMVAAPDGTVYVLDNQVPGVLVFSADGELQGVLGGPGPDGTGPLQRPYGIARDAEGRVWVTDLRERSQIVAFDPGTGRVVAAVPFAVPAQPQALERLPPRARGERAVALDLDFLPGGEMVVTDNTFGRVCILGREGALLREFGLPGDKPGEFNRPSKVTVDPEGRIFVLDAQNRRVQAFDAAGTFLFAAGSAQSLVGGFIGLSGIAWDAEGSLFVADSPMATIQAFDRSSGAYRYHVGGEGGAVDAGGQRPLWEVATPAGIAFNRQSGCLWIAMPMAHALAVRELLPLSGAASP